MKTLWLVGLMHALLLLSSCASPAKPDNIVGFGTDMSFGINAAETVSSFETSTSKQFQTGRYSDFIKDELIGYIDEQ